LAVQLGSLYQLVSGLDHLFLQPSSSQVPVAGQCREL